jgi:general secretion pathway protein J
MTVGARLTSGFTLIEVLVSVALMALIATILIASLQLGGHSWQRVTRAAENTEDIAQAQAFLRDHLATIYPNESETPSILTPGKLLSDGSTLEFSGFSPGAQANGILRYRIALDSSGGGTLEVGSRHDGDDSASTQASDWSHEPLLKHVSSVAIQFWQQSPDVPGHWVPNWRDAKELPGLIRIDVNFSPSDPRRWPSLYVQPRVDTAVTCQFDVVSRRCRSGA